MNTDTNHPPVPHQTRRPHHPPFRSCFSSPTYMIPEDRWSNFYTHNLLDLRKKERTHAAKSYVLMKDALRRSWGTSMSSVRQLSVRSK